MKKQIHRYIALDVEGSGVDFNNSQVIECGAIFLDEDLNPIQEKEWKINYIPKDFPDWNKDAEAVHKISYEEAQTHGIDPEEFIKEFEQEVFKFYGTNTDQSVHIIGVNAYYDYLMLECVWKKYRRGDFFLSLRTMDVNSIGLFVVGISGLSSLMENFGIEDDKEQRHSALYDAKLHLEVFKKLSKTAKEKGIRI